MRRLRDALALSVVLLTGCEGLTRIANPEVPLWVTHPGAAVSVFASRQLSSKSTRPDGEHYERSVPAIDAPHRRVFVGSSDGGLYALNAVDLSTLWRFQTDGAVQSEPLYDVSEDVVYFGSNDGALYKVRAADGYMLWRFASNAEIVRPPVMYRGTLFMVNANDTLVALDPATGELRWYRHRTPAGGMEISGYAGAAVHEDAVYTAFSTGVVAGYRIDDGRPIWRSVVDLTADAEQSRSGEELRYFDVDTTPIIAKRGAGDEPNDADMAMFVAHYEGGVYCLDLVSGGPLWVNDAATGVTELVLWEYPVRTDDRGSRVALGGAPKASGTHRVLVGSSGLTGLWGFDPKTGKELWRRNLPAGGVTAAAPWGGALLFGTTRYGLFLVSPLDGGVIDGVDSGAGFAATPAANGRRAFMISNEGQLLGLSLRPPS